MALEAETIIESGAFSGAVLAVSAVFLASMYKWPSFEVRGFEVLTHKPSIAAYRAPVAPQTIFAIDSHMEQIARALGVDPVEFRARHLMREGDPMANGQPWQSNGAAEVLRRIAEHPHWKNRAEWAASGGKDGHGLRGTGLALGGLAGRAPADGGHGAAQPGRLGQRAHRSGRHRRHQHRAGPDRRNGLRRRHRSASASPRGTRTSRR